jgi:hypothetical protein
VNSLPDLCMYIHVEQNMAMDLELHGRMEQVLTGRKRMLMRQKAKTYPQACPFAVPNAVLVMDGLVHVTMEPQRKLGGTRGITWRGIKRHKWWRTHNCSTHGSHPRRRLFNPYISINPPSSATVLFCLRSGRSTRQSNGRSTIHQFHCDS